MKIYTLKITQKLPVSIAEAWSFFSDPSNLEKITPTDMGFEVLEDYQGEAMYAGQVINYIVRPLFGISMRWTTEITHVQEPNYFVDEQRFGPYAFWHHKHMFKEIPGGVEMTDFLHYGIPYGCLGRIANAILVKNKLKEIFDYRRTILEERFGKF